MIRATRLNDSEIVVNADLIEMIEATRDTVITLIDGTRFIVLESPDELVQRIQRYRAGVLRLRDEPIVGDTSGLTAARSLTVVDDSDA